MSLKALLALFYGVFREGLRKGRRDLLGILLLTLFASLWGILAPYLLQRFVDEVVTQRNLGQTVRYFLAFAGSMALFTALWIGQISLATRWACSLFYELRIALVRTVLQKPIAFFRTFKSSDLLSRIMNDVDFMENVFYNNIVSGASFLVFCALMLLFILLWHWRLGSLLCLALVAYFFLLARLYRPVHRYSQQAREDLAAQNEVILDLVEGYREVKIFQQVDEAVARLAGKADRYRQTNRQFQRYADAVFIVSEGMGFFVSALPVFIGGWLVARDEPSITLGALVAYYALASVLLNHLRFSLEGLNKIYQCSAPLQRVKALLDDPEETLRIQSLDETPAGTTIVFDRVSFRHGAGEREILREFSLTIGENEKIAIVGASGSGKSTLLNLLVGFVRPNAGEIRFGGREISRYARGIYFNYYSYITQWNHLFQVSIRDNIAMGWYHVPDDEIRRVAALVKLDGVIAGFPAGYDTIVGRDGVTLSGGEQQRLAFARALLRDPKVLLLDEITAALDKQTEQALLDDVFSLFADKTILCVTHSRELAARFDRVIELTPPAPAGPAPLSGGRGWA